VNHDIGTEHLSGGYWLGMFHIEALLNLGGVLGQQQRHQPRLNRHNHIRVKVVPQLLLDAQVHLQEARF
jgi:hypothetical protein